MRGLMSAAKPEEKTQAPPPEAETDAAPEAGDTLEGVSPEEQKLYERVVANAYNLIYDKKSMPEILKSLNGDIPGEALAMTAATVVKRVADSARENGNPIPGDVLLHAGQEILEELADLQTEAGIADLPPQEVEAAFYKALDLYREMAQADGTLDEGALEQDFKTMVEANAAGELDQVLPGADAAADRFESGMAAMQQQENA
jgi:hypothetical protein